MTHCRVKKRSQRLNCAVSERHLKVFGKSQNGHVECLLKMNYNLRFLQNIYLEKSINSIRNKSLLMKYEHSFQFIIISINHVCHFEKKNGMQRAKLFLHIHRVMTDRLPKIGFSGTRIQP